MKKKSAVRRRLEDIPTFANVARLIVPDDTPPWLPAQLEWRSADAFHDRMLDEIRPTKAKTKAELERGAETLRSFARMVEGQFYRPLVEDAKNPQELPALIRSLKELAKRTETASRSKLLVNEHGKGKPGRGKFKLPNYADAKTRLAARVIEIWIYFYREEPGVRNRKLAAIAQAYWLACHGSSDGSGDPLNGWRKYFEHVRDRTECVELRHLRQHWKIDLAQTARRGSPPWYVGTYFPVSKGRI
jgi:hypothetical protein